MPNFEVFQSLWAMERSEPDSTTPALPDQIARIKSAGFDGVDIVYGDVPTADIAPMLVSHDLACTVTAFPDSVTALTPAVDMAVSLGARHLNIIGKVYPFSVDEGADYIRNWMAMCNGAGMPVVIETHRDCLTTDMHYTLQLMASVPDMPLNADLSHYVVGREMPWPVTAQVNAQVTTILNQSSAFQGRVASREQIQLQISFAHHQEWYDLFAHWWLEGFALWRQRATENDTLNFLCELGPPEYAMTGRDGKELSNRWEESLLLKDRARDLWDESEHYQKTQ